MYLTIFIFQTVIWFRLQINQTTLTFNNLVCAGTVKYYQLALVTPGIFPSEASWRNWLRQMPNLLR